MLKKLLISLLILSIFLPACAGNDTAKTSETKPETINDIETEPDRYTPDLPVKDFGGYEFRAAIPDNNFHATMTFAATEESGDLVNDAIYKRNMYIEEKFNVKLKEINLGPDFATVEAYFRKSVLGETDDFDLCVPLNPDKLAIEGFSLTPDQLPYVDITKPWYREGLNYEFSIGGKYYMAYSDECISVYESHIAVCFNKKLADDLNIDNMYNLVTNGTWTHEKLFDMCRVASIDLDGDGKMTDADQFGMVSQDDLFLYNFWVSAGVKVVTHDSDGFLMYNRAVDEKLERILTSVYNNVYAKEKIYFAAERDPITTTNFNNFDKREFSTFQFISDKGLFYSARILQISAMRGMETDFGVIPFPKYDEAQDTYYPLSYLGWGKIVPAHAPNPERTSIIMEALAAESKNTTIPAYKDVVLGVKYMRDAESVEMLNLIFDNSVYDQSVYIFNYQIRSVLYNVMKGAASYASAMAQNMDRWNVMFDDYNNAAREAMNK